MTTITLPQDLEQPLAEAARSQATTPESLAIQWLRDRLQVTAAPANNTGETLLDLLSGYIGTVEGSTEALSEHCGERFADGLEEKKRQGRL
jgi:hypothetical protein